MNFSMRALCTLLSFTLLLGNGFSQPTRSLVARHLWENVSDDTESLRAAEKNTLDTMANGTQLIGLKLAKGLRNNTNLTSMAEVGKQFTAELAGTGLTIAGLVGVVAPEIVIPASVAGGIAMEKARKVATERAHQKVNSTNAETIDSPAGSANDAKAEPNDLQ